MKSLSTEFDFKKLALNEIDLEKIPKPPYLLNSREFVFPLKWGQFEVYDFSKGYDPHRTLNTIYGVGKYDERRPNMYVGDQYTSGDQESRDIHMGIDLASPTGSDVIAFTHGTVVEKKFNSLSYDYGGTLVTNHEVELVRKGVSGRGDKFQLFVLWGHLSFESLAGLQPGQPFKTGDTLAQLGNETQNGGWNPHLHIQLSWLKPANCDLPGAVNNRDRNAALVIFPDPRLILGPLY